MPTCFVPGCKKNYRLKKTGVSYHAFPGRLKLKWLQAVGRDKDTFINQQRICSDHFLAEDYERIGLLRKLKPNVIPSVNLPKPKSSTSEVIPEASKNNETTSDLIMVAPSELPKHVAVRALPSESEMIHLRDEAPPSISLSDSGSQEEASTISSPKRRLFASDTPTNTSTSMSPPRSPSKKRLKTVVVSSTENSKSSKKRMVEDIQKMERKECIKSVEDYFHNICRICLKTENVYPIFSTQLDGIEAKILFEFCLSLQIDEQQPRPKNLCENCLIQLNDFYYFKKHCRENDIAFNNLILSKKDEFIVQNNELDQSFLENCSSEETQPSDENNCHEIIKTASSDNDSCDEIKHITFLDHSYTSPPGQSDLIKKFKCDHCSKQYTKNGSLNQHWRRYPRHRTAEKTIETKRIKIERTGQQSELISETKDKPHQPPKKIECPTCNAEFNTIEEKRAHQKKWRHTTRPCSCPICGKVCTSGYRLQSHLRTHSKEKPFQCERCSKSFSVFCNLIRHQKIHTGEKPFLCELCGQSFNRKDVLEQHSEVHVHLIGVRTGEGNKTRLKKSKNFMCEVCGQVYTSKTILSSHMKLHADPKFECLVCGKKFHVKALLNNHKFVHSNERVFKCRYCGKSFRQAVHRINHENSHTGEKRFACNYCYKSFALKSNLRVHIRIHTGEKPYKCSVCGKGFYESGSRKKHLRTVHPNAVLDDETTKNVV